MFNCDKPSKFSRSECHILGWKYNLSTLNQNVTVVNTVVTKADLLCGRFTWVRMLRGWLLGGRIVTAPTIGELNVDSLEPGDVLIT
jgi:hypothetical protein